jgi:putative ABC transport system substrate-binding protein
VGFGFVKTLAQPGGTLTGFSRALEKLTVKRLELLNEMLPRARRIGFLFIEDNVHHRQQADDVRRAADSRRLSVVNYPLPLNEWSAERLEETFAQMRRDGMDAFLLPDINVQGQVVVALAAKYRLPTIHALSHVVTDWGGLAAYTTSAPDELFGVADYAVRVFKGEMARDLPVQEPAQFELVLNTRAANAIGVSFPKKFLLRATRVVDR